MPATPEFAPSSRPPAVRYAVAVGFVGLAAVARLALAPVVGNQFPFLTFYLALLAAAWAGGLGPTLVAAVLGGVATAVLFVPHGPTGRELFVPLTVYATVSAGICAFVRVAEQAYIRAAAAAADAQTRQRQLEHEVGERRKAEEEVRRREGLFRAVFEGTAAAVALADPVSGRFIRVNRKFCELTGYAEAELYHLGFLDITHPDDRDANWARYQELAVGRVPEYVIEKRYVRKDGRAVWVRGNVVIAQEADGRPEYTAAVFQDVTDRRTAEAALLDREAMLRTLGDNLPGAVYQAVRPPGEPTRFRHMSAGIERLLGVTPEQAVADPMSVYGRIHPDDLPRVVAAEEAALRDGGTFDCEMRQRTVAGEEKWVQVRSSPRTLADGTVVYDGIATDVTARKAAERVLDRYRLLSEYARDVVFFLRPDGRIVEANDAAAATYGYTRDEFLGLTVADLREPATVHQLAGQLAEADRCGVRFETVHRRKDGTTFPAEVSSRGADVGGERLLVSIVRDITERRRALDDLARLATESDRQRRVYETALSNTPDLVYVFDLDHRFTYANEALLAMWGRTWADAAGKNCLELGYEPWHAAMHDREIDQVVTTRRPIRGEVPFTGTNGRRIYDYIFVPVLGAGGEVVAVAGTTRDVTDRKHAEDALRQSEARFRAFMDNSPTAAWVTDADGRIEYLNAGYFQMFHLPPGDLIGKSVFDLYPEPIAREYAANIRAVAESGRPAQSVEPGLRRDESAGQYLVCKFPLPDGGRPLVGGMAVDITDRVAAEDALKEADRRKDEFLAMLGHELRNPLAPVRNGLAILGSPNVDPPTAGRVREMMARQIEHLVRLVDDLLDVSRIMRGKIDLRRERVDLAAVVGRAVETARPGVDARSHRLTVDLPAGPLPVDGDVVRLTQVLANLLGNAAKYTDPGGAITLTAAAEGEHAVVRVRDTGIGIPREHLPHVFDLFVQVDRSAARSDGGLGIGLTLVKRLVELHGGSAAVASDGPGQGSTFTVRLPVRSDEYGVMSAELKAQPTADFDSSLIAHHSSLQRRVLVVDDNVDAADTLAAVLQLQGHEVRTANDGPAALEAATNGWRPDAVVLDIGLPGMDGYEVARRLRVGPAAGAVLVAVTGYGRDQDRRQSAEAGFDHHFTKPIDPDALHRVLSGSPNPLRSIR